MTLGSYPSNVVSSTLCGRYVVVTRTIALAGDAILVVPVSSGWHRITLVQGVLRRLPIWGYFDMIVDDDHGLGLVVGELKSKFREWPLTDESPGHSCE